MRMPAIAMVMLVARASRSSAVVNSYDTVGSRKYAHAALSVSRIRSSKYRTASLLRALDVLLIRWFPDPHSLRGRTRAPAALCARRLPTGSSRDLLPWVAVGCLDEAAGDDAAERDVGLPGGRAQCAQLI